jgi:Cu(I)/Ag(I) efflux system membrane fusion protein
MGKLLIAGIAAAAILPLLASAPYLRRQQLPAQTAATPSKAVADRKVLYWKDPDAGTDFSPTPTKTADGRSYVPVYEDQEPGFAEAKPKVAAGKGKLLYYRNPMGLQDTSPVPKKDGMGMDYIPVYEDEEAGGSTVKVSLDKVQRSGVRTAPVEMRRLDRPVRAPGVAKPDERSLRVVALRADGFIEKLYVNQTGQHVQAGEPLFRVYSPESNIRFGDPLPIELSLFGVAPALIAAITWVAVAPGWASR